MLGGGTGTGRVLRLVDQAFFQSCQIWTMVVSSDFGRCFSTKSEVRPGHVEK